jgi:phospholipid/cholesterol/gamma-HCH transport system substrate-binding protein
MIVGAALLAIFIAVPVGFSLTKKVKTYYTYFDESVSLSGLEQGADVKFRGVPIGKVASISYNPRDISQVKATFTVQADFPLKKDMYLTTGMMGITGLKYVEIMGGTDTAAILPPESEVPSRPSLFESITGKTDVLVGKVELLLNHLTTMTNPDSLAGIKQIIDNVAAITDETRTFVKTARPDIQQVTSAAGRAAKKVDKIASDMETFTANFSRGFDAARIHDILASVDSAALSMKNMSEDLDLTIRQTREDFTISMQNLRETLENANELSKLLAENPSLLIRSEQQRERIIR